MQKANPDYGVGINPISRLIQIQQAQQKKEPVYTLVTERGLPRRREFVIQVNMSQSGSFMEQRVCYTGKYATKWVIHGTESLLYR